MSIQAQKGGEDIHPNHSQLGTRRRCFVSNALRLLYPRWRHTYCTYDGALIKSLAPPTFRCRRTESIVSLERVVCSCAELQVFSCYRGLKEACQSTRAISTTSRRELSSSFFSFVRQDAEGNSRHSERNIMGTRTIVCYRQKLDFPV